MDTGNIYEHQPEVDYVHGVALAAAVRLTPQEERFISLFCYGFPLQQAARNANMPADRAQALLDDPRYTAVIDQMRAVYADEVRITRETLTVLLLEAHRKAGSAGEEISALKEIGKLHGLYKSDDQRGTKITTNTQVNVGDVTVTGKRKFSRLTTEQLIALAELPIDPNEES